MRTRTLFSYIYSRYIHMYLIAVVFPNIGLVIGVAYHVYADSLFICCFIRGWFVLCLSFIACLQNGSIFDVLARTGYWCLGDCRTQACILVQGCCFELSCASYKYFRRSGIFTIIWSYVFVVFCLLVKRNGWTYVSNMSTHSNTPLVILPWDKACFNTSTRTAPTLITVLEIDKTSLENGG